MNDIRTTAPARPQPERKLPRFVILARQLMDASLPIPVPLASAVERSPLPLALDTRTTWPSWAVDRGYTEEQVAVLNSAVGALVRSPCPALRRRRQACWSGVRGRPPFGCPPSASPFAAEGRADAGARAYASFPSAAADRAERPACPQPQAWSPLMLAAPSTEADRRRQFWPTPTSLAAVLPLGLEQLGIAIPATALDPCGGAGHLRRGLRRHGVDVQLTDLHPELHPGVDGYVSTEPSDARDVAGLRLSLLDAGQPRAIFTNPPFATSGAPRVARAALALIDAGEVDLFAMVIHLNWISEETRGEFRDHPAFVGQAVASWRVRWIEDTSERPTKLFAWNIWHRGNNYPPRVVYVSEKAAMSAASTG